MRVNDVKKASYDFKREIEQQSRHQRTGKIMAERVARDFEENLRYKVFGYINLILISWYNSRL